MSASARIMLIFTAPAMVVGSMFSRLPEIQLSLSLDAGDFGIVLMAIPLGVFTSSLFISRIIKAVGTRMASLLFFPICTGTPLLSVFAGNQTTLFCALFVSGATLSAAGITMNVEANRIEQTSKRRVINRCHGSWGLGFLMATLLGAGAIRFGVSPLTHFCFLFLLVGVASAFLVAGLSDVAMPASDIEIADKGKSKLMALPNKGTFLLVAFAFSSFWLEGSARNWSVIYMRDGFGALDWFSALALPAMFSMQTLGRFMADGWITRYGPVKVARILTGVALIGLITIVSAPTALTALFGFALMGLGVSTTYPQAVSAAARWGGRSSVENVAAFSTLQTLISFVAPPVFGLIAAWFSLRIAWAVFLPLPIVALYFARVLAPHETTE